MESDPAAADATVEIALVQGTEVVRTYRFRAGERILIQGGALPAEYTLRVLPDLCSAAVTLVARLETDVVLRFADDRT